MCALSHTLLGWVAQTGHAARWHVLANI